MMGAALRPPLLLLLFLFRGAGAQLDVSVVPPKPAAIGLDALLECTFTVGSRLIHLQYLGILWSFQGRNLLVYDGKLKVFDPRASINESEIPKGTASLLLANVTTSDEGDYTCSVTYTPEKEQKTVTLNIQARPEIVVPEQEVIRGKENLLRCSVVGFYPVQIDAFWLRDGNPLPGSSTSKPLRNTNGTYTINTTMPVTPTDDDTSLNFSCGVSHVSLPRPLQKQVLLSITEDAGQNGVIIGITVVLTVVVAAVVVAVLGVFWYKRNSARGKVRLCDIQGPEIWIVGETTVLVCVGHHCPKRAEAKWMKRCEDSEEEIEVGASSVCQDTLPLLDLDHYRAETSKDPEGDGCYTVTCRLRVNARLEEDQGAVFKCRVFTSIIDAEKEFKDFRLFAKPEAKGIHCCPCDGNRVLCTMNLSNFYPEEIQVNWFVGVGKLQETPSENHVTRTSDQGTFDVRSECELREEDFSDPNFKINVTWEHLSLQAPQYKELSVTDSDFPGRPVLGNIRVPPLSSEQEASLSCRVSGYFPREIQVTWLKMQTGSNEPVALSGGNQRCELTEQLLEEGVGYSCMAILTFIPDLTTDQEAEFICQVSHPSLQEPMRKITPKLPVTDWVFID